MKNNEEYSLEVREIMGEGAHWMVRWGSSLLAIIVVVMIGVFFLIRYPVFVQAQLPALSTRADSEIVSSEAIVSRGVYDQIQAGQEVNLVTLATTDRKIAGYVRAKSAGSRVQLTFAVTAGQKMQLLKTLRAGGDVKIKIGERRLLSQFRGLFNAK